MPRSLSFLPIAQALRTCVTKSCGPRRSPIAAPPPVGGHTGATSEPTTNPRAAILSRSRFSSSSVASMLTCGSNRNRSTPSNFAPFDRRARGEVEHGVEIDRRLGVGPFADQSRPHRVVDGRPFVLRRVHGTSGASRHRAVATHRARSSRNGSASGLPGPKCFKITSGSVALRFSMRTPVLRRIGRHEQLVFRHVAEADHRRRRHAQRAEHAVALRQDDAVGRAVRDGDARASGSTVSSFAEYQPVP